MPQSPIAPNLNKALDIEVDLASKVSLDHVVAVDVIPDLGDFLVQKVLDSNIRLDSGGPNGLHGPGPANAIDVGKGDVDLLVIGNVNAGDSCQTLPPLLRHALVIGVATILTPAVACDAGSDRSRAPPRSGE